MRVAKIQLKPLGFYLALKMKRKQERQKIRSIRDQMSLASGRSQ